MLIIWNFERCQNHQDWTQKRAETTQKQMTVSLSVVMLRAKPLSELWNHMKWFCSEHIVRLTHVSETSKSHEQDTVFFGQSSQLGKQVRMPKSSCKRKCSVVGACWFVSDHAAFHLDFSLILQQCSLSEKLVEVHQIKVGGLFQWFSSRWQVHKAFVLFFISRKRMNRQKWCHCSHPTRNWCDTVTHETGALFDFEIFECMFQSDPFKWLFCFALLKLSRKSHFFPHVCVNAQKGTNVVKWWVSLKDWQSVWFCH